MACECMNLQLESNSAALVIFTHGPSSLPLAHVTPESSSFMRNLKCKLINA